MSGHQASQVGKGADPSRDSGEHTAWVWVAVLLLFSRSTVSNSLQPHGL